MKVIILYPCLCVDTWDGAATGRGPEADDATYRPPPLLNPQ